MLKDNSKKVCLQCKKQLQKADCIECGGSGKNQSLLSEGQECPVCLGSGQVLRCPDVFKHIQEGQDIKGSISTSSQSPAPKITPGWPPNKPYRNPQNPKNPFNPNPLNPNNPNIKRLHGDTSTNAPPPKRRFKKGE